MGNKFKLKSGFESSESSEITGSLIVSSNITSSGDISSSGTIIANSFSGGGAGITGVVSSSYALTASFALNSSGGVPAGTLSSSAQISTEISGAFTSPSASFSTRVTANEVVTAKTLVSSSAQIATEISGAFTAASGGFSSRVTTLEAGGGGSGIFSATGSVQSTTNNLRITGSVFIDDTTTNSGSLEENSIFKTKGTLGNLFSVTNDLSDNLLNVKDISGVTLFKVSGSGEILMKDLPTTQPTITGSLWISGSGTPPGAAGSGYLMIYTGGG